MGDQEQADAQSNLWQRIRGGFVLEEIDSALVASHEAWYLNRPEYVQRMVERSRRYLYYIVEEFEKRNMPTEIALLPMIESAYNPHGRTRAPCLRHLAVHPVHRARLRAAAELLVRRRRDVLAATDAALDYLQFLHDMFGDWELALAAYNWGEERAARDRAQPCAGKPTDYLSMKMPKETRNYLPKLQAVKNIVANPALLGFELEPVPNQPYFAVVKRPATSTWKAAQLADMPVEEFRSLNPGYNRPGDHPGGSAPVLLPVDKVDEFHANLENNDEPLVTLADLHVEEE